MKARGALELLWEPCYEAGDDYLGTVNDIETLVGWTGEPGQLTLALVEAGKPEGHGFIEIVTDHADALRVTYRVHDLWHHAPDYVQKRHQREVQRRQRHAPSAKRRRSAPNGGHCPPSPDRQIEVDRTPAPAPAPALAPAPARAPALSESAAPVASLIDGRALRRHGEHAWCDFGRSVCVTAGLHAELIGRLGTADADARLRAWYPTVLAKYAGRPIGDDLFAFWRNEFGAWVGTVTAKPIAVVGKGNSSRDAMARTLARRAASRGESLQ